MTVRKEKIISFAQWWEVIPCEKNYIGRCNNNPLQSEYNIIRKTQVQTTDAAIQK